MKPIAMADEAYFNGQRSFFAIHHGQNREGCVMDKSPFSSIYHAEYSLYINTLKAFFRKIVMGDRWFAKTFALGVGKINHHQAQPHSLLHISYQLLSSIRQEKRDIDKSIILLETNFLTFFILLSTYFTVFQEPPTIIIYRTFASGILPSPKGANVNNRGWNDRREWNLRIADILSIVPKGGEQ